LLPWQGYGRHLTHNLSLRLLQQLRTASFDVLLQDELNHPSLFWLNRRLRGKVSYPIISIVHHLRVSEAHPRWQMTLYRPVERAYLRSVDGFVCNSQATRQAVERMLTDYRSRPSIVAYPSGSRFGPTITEAEILARAQTAGPLRVLFVGNLIPRKGLHTLLGALCQLEGADWRLDVVGNTAVNPAYVHHIQSNLPPHVTLHGTQSDGELAGWFRHSHVLAVPSQHEGFGIVYLEGMGFGLPAVGTTDGGASEVIEDWVSGYLVKWGDTAVLSQHLLHLSRNREHLGQMGLAARQRFLAHPTWAESMAQVRAFLCEQVSK
jgi:glycosyltransferase involved in cell wall biosynthesis